MLWQKEREHGDLKSHKGMLVVTADLYDKDNNCVSETNSNEENSVQNSKCPAIHTNEKSLSPETDLFLSDSEKSDFVTNIKKSFENEETSSLVDKPCSNSEPSGSSGTLPSPSGSNGKKTLSLKARRRKTLSPNTFSRNKSQNIYKEKSSESEVAKSILIADDDEEKEGMKCVNDETMKNTVENVQENICKTSMDSENTDSFNLLDSQSSLDLFPPSIEACEKIKTKRKRGRGRPAKYRRASLPAPVKKPSVNSSESQESQELETLILLQESLGMGSPIERRKTRNSRSCQPIVLSSLFQYIIDEAKREQGEKDFALPGYTFGKLMESKNFLEIKNEAMEEDAKDECEKLKEETDFSQTEHMSMLTEVCDHSTHTAGESECQDNEIQKQEKFIEALEQQEPRVEDEGNVPERKFSPDAQCDTISNSPSLNTMHLKTGHLSDISDSESEDIEEESCAPKEIQEKKVEDLSVNEEHNTNRETKSSDALMSCDEPVPLTVCPDSQQPEQMKVSQQSEEDSQGEQDLNSSLGSDQQTESDDDNFGDILKERMATKVRSIMTQV